MGRYDFLLNPNHGTPPISHPDEQSGRDQGTKPPRSSPLTSSIPSHLELAPDTVSDHADASSRLAPLSSAAADVTPALSAELGEPKGSDMPPFSRAPAGNSAKTSASTSLPTPPRKHVSTESDGASPDATAPADAGTLGRFDMTVPADQKYTLAFASEELEALEDVKLELRRRFDLKTTKVALVRCGLWDLIEDYQHHGEQSRVVKRLKTHHPPRSKR